MYIVYYSRGKTSKKKKNSTFYKFFLFAVKIRRVKYFERKTQHFSSKYFRYVLWIFFVHSIIPKCAMSLPIFYSKTKYQRRGNVKNNFSVSYDRPVFFFNNKQYILIQKWMVLLSVFCVWTTIYEPHQFKSGWSRKVWDRRYIVDYYFQTIYLFNIGYINVMRIIFYTLL